MAAGGSQRAQPLAEGAIADLVVVLNERDEGAGRKVGARAAARRPAVRARSRPDRRSLRRAPGPGASSPRNRRNSRSFRASRRRAARGGGRRSTAPCRGEACAGGGRAAAARCSRSRAGDGSVRSKRDRRRAASSSTMSGRLSSLIACTASSRSPSRRKASTQYSAFSITKSRTGRASGPSKLIASPHGVRWRAGEKFRRVAARGNSPPVRNDCRRRRAARRCRARAPLRRRP